MRTGGQDDNCRGSAWIILHIYVKKSRIKDAILKLKDEKVKRDILEAITIR